MKVKCKRTNLIARDWQRLAKFYEDVFGCVRVPPERHLSGLWLEKGTAVKGARFSGVHPALPGYQGQTPTLENYQYSHNEDRPVPAANREGLGHIAFEVEYVAAARDIMRQHGDRSPGEIISQEIPNVGLLTFVYATDLEGNVLELRNCH